MGVSPPFRIVLVLWLVAQNVSVSLAGDEEDLDVLTKSGEFVNSQLPDERIHNEDEDVELSDPPDADDGDRRGVEGEDSTSQRSSTYRAFVNGPAQVPSSKDKEKVGGKDVEEDNKNPPFPSQSSSFWEHEAEEQGHRDYETNPNSDIPIVRRKDDDDDVNERLATGTGGDTPTTSDAADRPNIILIITDDQDIELGSMDYMPETLKIFREGGVEFRHGYVSTPICCPSRSSLLTGLYVHNHEVFTNNDNCSSIQWREKFEKKTFASYLWSSGYYTSYIGKYLNKYDGSHIPHGWDEWNGLLMNSRYYNYTLNRNGKRFRYGNDLEKDYYPDLIARDGLDFLERVAADKSKQPFLLVLSFPSPHGPEDSAPRYSNLFLNATPHHIPNYNYAPNSDKQWILRQTNKMTPMLKEFTNLLMTKRLQTLQSVDVAVRDIFQKLEAASLRDSTYSFYTSDHGYHVGQFGLVKGKSMPYEFDIRVPFFLAGPKGMVQGGTMIQEPVLNIDFVPTFLELANLPIPDDIDGRSMVPLIKKYCPSCKKGDTLEWPDVFLIESPGRRSPPTNPESGSGEVFDKHSRKLQKRKHREKVIVDDDEVLSLSHLCALHPHPCLPGQKKYCRKEKNRIRFRKCRQNIDFLVSTRLLNPDPRINDPVVYGHNATEVSNQKCSCRFKRSVVSEEHLEDEADVAGLDWEVEKRRIDDEIEKLKQRIEYLRQRRKEIRRKWLADNNFAMKVNASQRGREDRQKKERGKNPAVVGAGITSEDNEEPEVPHEEDYEASNESEESEKDEKEEGGGISEEDSDDDDEEDENHDPKAGGSERKPPKNEEAKEIDKNVEGNVPLVEDENKMENTKSDPVLESSSVLRETSEEIEISQTRSGKELSTSTVGTSTTTSTRKPHQRGKNKNSRNKLKGMYMFNKNPPPTPTVGSEDEGNCNCYNDPRWLRQKEREDRKHRKILSKIRKKQRLFKRIEDPVERQQAETCGKEEKMNCFWHDSDHWRTAPFWTSGSFCFCMNANNNSYSCLRSVNSTHNYLYCQFVTGFKMYFDLMQDPYQLKNTIDTLPASSEDWIMNRLYKLKQCKGREECWSNESASEDSIHPSLWEQIFGRWPKKRRRGGRRRKYQGGSS